MLLIDGSSITHKNQSMYTQKRANIKSEPIQEDQPILHWGEFEGETSAAPVSSMVDVAH